MSETERPKPLVPADVDLRNFPDMSFDVDRLLQSETWVLANGDERATAFALWAQSWRQVPAGSLPSDQRMLEHLSMSKKWKATKAHAMRGWVLCSDGRLYHRFVCGKALEAWIEKLVSGVSGAMGNAKRWNVQIDLDSQRGRVLQAVELLRAINPQSYVLKKKAVLQIVSASHRESPPDMPAGSGGDLGDESGGDRFLEQNRTEQNGSLFPSHEGSGAARRAAPEPEPLPDFNGLNAELFPGKAVAALAVDFDLPEEWGLDAERLGWRPTDVARQAERFRQYWVAGKGKGTRRAVKGWRQTWSNWLEKAAGDRR